MLWPPKVNKVKLLFGNCWLSHVMNVFLLHQVLFLLHQVLLEMLNVPPAHLRLVYDNHRESPSGLLQALHQLWVYYCCVIYSSTYTQTKNNCIMKVLNVMHFSNRWQFQASVLMSFHQACVIRPKLVENSPSLNVFFCQIQL